MMSTQGKTRRAGDDSVNLAVEISGSPNLVHKIGIIHSHIPLGTKLSYYVVFFFFLNARRVYP
jgi:hypothetical protein